MEGISDGRAIDSCYFCQLLFPDIESCPRCENRMHYESAHILTMEEIDKTVIALSARYLESKQAKEAEELLHFLHKFGHDAMQSFASQPIKWDQLRSLFSETNRQ